LAGRGLLPGGWVACIRTKKKDVKGCSVWLVGGGWGSGVEYIHRKREKGEEWKGNVLLFNGRGTCLRVKMTVSHLSEGVQYRVSGKNEGGGLLLKAQSRILR